MFNKAPRSCGECQACCIAPYIKELAKPAHVRCEHLNQRGCGVYTKRPEVCREFDCAWLHGFYGLSHSQRPDKSGLIIYVRATEPNEIKAAEVWRDAHKTPLGQGVLAKVTGRGVPVVPIPAPRKEPSA